MTSLDIVRWRLHNQRISQQTFAKPVDVVQWLGAVQAQDYKDKVHIILNPFTPLSDAETRAVAAVADHYGAFLGLPVQVTLLL